MEGEGGGGGKGEARGGAAGGAARPRAGGGGGGVRDEGRAREPRARAAGAPRRVRPAAPQVVRLRVEDDAAADDVRGAEARDADARVDAPVAREDVAEVARVAGGAVAPAVRVALGVPVAAHARAPAARVGGFVDVEAVEAVPQPRDARPHVHDGAVAVVGDDDGAVAERRARHRGGREGARGGGGAEGGRRGARGAHRRVGEGEGGAACAARARLPPESRIFFRPHLCHRRSLVPNLHRASPLAADGMDGVLGLLGLLVLWVARQLSRLRALVMPRLRALVAAPRDAAADAAEAPAAEEPPAGGGGRATAAPLPEEDAPPPPPPAAEEDDAPPPAAPCARPPDDVTGECPPHFELDEAGCCALKPAPEGPSDLEAYATLGATVARDVAAGAAVDFMAKKVAARVGAKLATRFGQRTAVKAVSRAVTSMTAKIAAKSALAGKIAATGVGAPVAALMLAFDAVSILLDMGDPEGYNNFTENAITQRALRAAWARMQTTALETGRDYPMVFPVEQAFPEAWASAAMPALYDMVGADAFGDLSEAQIERLADAAADDADVPADVAAALDAAYQRRMHADPARRDRVLLEALRAAVPEPDHLALYPALSSPTRIGVSLSPAGVRWWNEAQRGAWFRYHDVFGAAPDMPEGHVDPPVALHTDTYYVLNEADPGTAEAPNMIARKVPGGAPAALFLVGGHIVSYCEKPKDVDAPERDLTACPGPHAGALCQPRSCDADGGGGGGAAACHALTTREQCEGPCRWVGPVDETDGIDPRKYGVRFEDGTGRFKGTVGCLYTDCFCTRVGMKHRYDHETKASDCWKDGGQDMSESLFGTTITRGIQRGIHNLIGKVCDPCCAPDEYCEDRKCHKKKGLGKTVGPTASWKCLSGHEQWAKCVECKDVDADCDGKPRTSRGFDCSVPGTCFCEPATKGGGKGNTCAPKRKNCVPTDKGKCCAHDGDAACLKGGDKWEKEWDRYGCDDDAHCADGYCDRTAGQVNRCRRRDSVKDRAAGDFCRADDQCAGGMICRHHTCVDLRNENKNCWADCGRRPGGCPQFCGADGACCRHNENKNYPECRGHGPMGWSGCIERKDGREGEDFVSRRKDVALGGACVVGANCASGRCSGRTCRPKLDRGGKCASGADCTAGLICRHGTCVDLRNENKNCWAACGRRPGGCPQFCGKDGACCRHNENKEYPECRGHGPTGWSGCIERKDGREGEDFVSRRTKVPDGGACVVSANCASGRCRGRTCRPKLDRGGKCASGADCRAGLICRHGTCLELRNERKNCWNSCGRRGGGCPQFCGADGACCRHNEERGRPECRGHGPAGWHSCIERKDGKAGQDFPSRSRRPSRPSRPSRSSRSSRSSRPSRPGRSRRRA